jgi:hypothetical protein
MKVSIIEWLLVNLFPCTIFKIVLFIIHITYLDLLFSKELRSHLFIVRYHPLISAKCSKCMSLSIYLEERDSD